MPDDIPAAGEAPRRLFYRNSGFLTQPRLRRMLALAGQELRLWGRPASGDGVAVWGASPHALRGERLAARHGVPLVRIEDAFLRSIRPGRSGEAGLGLIIDPLGVHFDPTTPSRIEAILSGDPLDNSNLLLRARDGISRIHALELSKYNIHDPSLAAPAPGYVLVVDQTRGDASLRGAGPAAFRQMLAAAQDENPGTRIIIKTHPETAAGHRPGHFGPKDAGAQVSLCAKPISPWQLLEGAVAVYVMSSQLGFEAILAGHRPRIFGQPFYAGWGLTDDRDPPPRRGRRLTAAQLFAGAMILAPTWYDPCRDRLCSFEEAVDQLEAEVRAFREDRSGHVAAGMRAWKRGRLQQFFGGPKGLRFRATPEGAAGLAARQGRGVLVWGAAAAPEGVPLRRVEDGFLRSAGLGAALVPPLSLIADDLGIYYDPHRESRFERLMQAPLPPGAAARAARLRAALVASGVTKYNLTGTLPEMPAGRRILVPGQVADDASIRLGCGEVTDNLGLLRAVRAANPDAVIVWKPHPDVVAGLRPGAVAAADLAGLVDVVAHDADPAALIATCDEIWTLTSTLGFEALLRGKPVTTLGAPFYAGWGLTRDLGLMPQGWQQPSAPIFDACGNIVTQAVAERRFSVIPARRRLDAEGHRRPRVSLDHLTHAALIAYPRYFDPISRRPCPPEVVLERLARGIIPPPGPGLRLLSRLQGFLAPAAGLWRRGQ